MSLGDFKTIGPLAYMGKEDCDSVLCRRSGGPGRLDDGSYDFGECIGWHCSYCEEPTSYQGHNCDAAEAILGEAKRLALPVLPAHNNQEPDSRE